MKDSVKAYALAWMTAEQLAGLADLFCRMYPNCEGCPFYDEENPKDCGIVYPQLRLERFVHHFEYEETVRCLHN